jgi:hypothetical protein
MRIRWEPGAVASVTYFVDDVPVGIADAGFDHVLDLVGSDTGPVTLVIPSIAPGGGDLDDSLPFGNRMGELRRRLGERQVRYELFGWA